MPCISELAAVIGGEADRRAGERGAEIGPAFSPQEKALRLLLPLLAAARLSLELLRFELSGSMCGFGYAWP